MNSRSYIRNLIPLTLTFFLCPDVYCKDVGNKSMGFGEQEARLAETEATATVHQISRDIQGLKSDVIDLNRDLRIMEEELLFPSSTQYSVFVSMNVGKFFTLESLRLKLDGKTVTSHLYSPKQRQALTRGGVQKLYVTNLNEGKHTIAAFFTGLGPNGRSYKRAKEIEVVKGAGSQHLEIAIIDDTASQEPRFNIKQW